ncbi:hypothetical protein GQ457_04G002390 [Hibiscus cannabinus]
MGTVKMESEKGRELVKAVANPKPVKKRSNSKSNGSPVRKETTSHLSSLSPVPPIVDSKPSVTKLTVT